VVAARQADSSIAAELVGLAQAQKAAGVSAAIDVTRARTQLVAAEGALIVARNQLDRARIDLARALGIDPATPLALVDTLAAALPHADVSATRDTVVAMALARRPDLQAERARGDAARSAKSAILAERLPRLDVAADYGVNGLTPGSSIATRQVGVQVTIPILDGFRREGRAAEQEAVVRETEVRARDLRQQIVADVDGALLDLASAEAQQAIAAERLNLANDELAQARERFKAGVAGNIEVIDAQSSLLRARDTDIDARSAAAMARVALARAAGVARTLH
jgi:outer membrane protein TolC